MTSLEKVEQLKAELDGLRPLDAEAEARIMQKFRLDWNYHSNHLEGNSLTYSETTALVLHDRYIGDKSGKDYREMLDHNEVIKWIEEISKEEDFSLREVFIKQIHQLLLKKPYFVYAETAEGIPTRRRIEIGKYKSQPNHVLTQTGEIFYFATPLETPAKMEELINWFRNEKEKSDANQIILAALFHYKFIRIHPFDDGNGRVARILMNFILMQHGFPPVIIKTNDKENYFSILQQADAGIFEPFIEYIASNLTRSLELMIKGAKGESIEEPDDLDKELALLEQRIRDTGRKIEIPRSKEVVVEIYDNSIQKLISEFIKSCEKFNKFYVENEFTLFVDGGAPHKSKEDAMSSARKKIEENSWGVSEIHPRYYYVAFNQEGYGDFNYESEILITFGQTKYRVSSGINYEMLRNNSSDAAKDVLIYEKLYSDRLSEEEITTLVKLKFNQHKNLIEQKYEERQSRI